MAKQEPLKFNNNRSVRFALDSFAVPVEGNRKKNNIYTALLFNMTGTKSKLLPPQPAVNTFGYKHIAKWGFWIFAADSTGIYVSDSTFINFKLVTGYINSHRIRISNERLFAIALDRRRIFYTSNLKKEWIPEELMEGTVHLPDDYGLCLDIMLYRNNLLVVCEKGLLTIDKNLNLKHLLDDSDIIVANMEENSKKLWESDWFSLGYATDTQTLRDVFIKTNIPLLLEVNSNKMKRVIQIKANEAVQKIKTNLRGDQFKISLVVLGDEFSISNLNAVVEYGKRSN